MVWQRLLARSFAGERGSTLTVAWKVGFAPAARDATVFEIERVKIPTASLDALIESGRTGRLQDAADIEALEAVKRLRS